MGQLRIRETQGPKHHEQIQPSPIPILCLLSSQNQISDEIIFSKGMRPHTFPPPQRAKYDIQVSVITPPHMPPASPHTYICRQQQEDGRPHMEDHRWGRRA